MSKVLYFKLFANCIPVKGVKRSCLCDLQRGTIKFIPNLLYDILIKKKKTILDIKGEYNNEYDKGIDNYFSLLKKEEWGFYTNEPDKFPDLDLEWHSPIIITNAIFDYNPYWESEIPQAFEQLNELGCEALQLRFYDQIKIKTIDALLATLSKSRIKSIELLIKYNVNSEEDIILLCQTHLRIHSIIIHSAPYNKFVLDNKNLLVSLNYTTNVIDSKFHCGQINSLHFSLNIHSFIESQTRNSCLNQKISIDIKGEIKNCPSLNKSYGNIKNTTLKQAIEKQGFKDLWKIKKDDIDICKECEFRYVCTDCRAYIEDPENLYSKPLKCGYDPYTSKWEDWSINPLKQKAIQFYNIQGW
jgi:SPASM domain peptide maturase of grasp-with-spasm system